MNRFGKCQDLKCDHYEYQHAPNKLCIGINENNLGCWCREFKPANVTSSQVYSTKETC